MNSRVVGTHLVLAGGFAAIALVPGLAGPAAAGFGLSLVGPSLRRRWPGLEPLGEIGTVVAVVVAAIAWATGISAPTVVGGLLIYLQVHRRVARTGPGAARVALVIAALMLVTAAGVTRAAALAPCLVAWTLGLPLALLDEGPRRGPWAGLGLGTAAVTAAIFVGVPRSTPPPVTAGMTGFVPEVQLGELGELLDDPRVVFRASIDPPPDGRPYWRGVALDTFDGTGWHSALDAEGPVESPPPLPPLPIAADLPQPTWTVDVQVVDQSERVLFVPGAVLGYAGPPAARLAGGAWTTLDDEPAAFVTWVAPFRDRGPVDRREAGHPLAQEGLAVDPRIVALAEQVAGEGSPEERVARLTDHLRTSYLYARRAYGGEEPLVGFLFEGRGGHCEYFASALAVMVRSLGLPARVVTGFVGGERNPITGQWVVRRMDAHSWVEVGLPGRGWVLFDPTPQGDDDGPSSIDLDQLVGAAASTWTSALDYDGVDQARAAAAARALFRGADPSVRARTWSVGVLAVVAAGSLLVGVAGRRRRKSGRPGDPPSRWARLHQRARRALGRRLGRPVPDALPPRAVADWLADQVDAPLVEAYRELVTIVYDAVIGGRDTDDRYARARELLGRLERGGGG